MKSKFYVISFLAIFIVSVLAPINTACALEIIKGPYLQNVTSGSIVIMWETDILSDSTVTYNDGSTKTVTDSSLVTIHEIKLSGLNYNGLYLYNVTSVAADNTTVISEIPGFYRAPDSAQDFSFAVFGDTHVFDDLTLPTIISSMISKRPDIVLHTGDISLGDLDFFIAKTYPLIKNTPLFPVRGNHDDEEDQDWFSEYFSLPNNELWYAFTYGNVLFIGLDTNVFDSESPAYDADLAEAQNNWLEEQLSSASCDLWKIVYFHKPPFTAGSVHENNQYVIEHWFPLFRQYGVNIVFSGHTHAYEHYYDSYYDTVSGTHYLVAGGGTSYYHDVGDPTDLPSGIERKMYKTGVPLYCTVDVSVADKTLTFNAWDASTDTTSLIDNFTINKAESQPIELGAAGEVSVQGIATGDYKNTYYSDNSHEVLQEVLSSNNPRNAYSILEHKWTFNLGSTSTYAEFYVEAYRSGSEDDFVFSYSTDGITYTNMVIINSGIEQTQVYSFPQSLSGTIYIRVMDTNRTKGKTSRDSLYVDQICILITDGVYNYGASNPYPMNGATKVAKSGTLSWNPGINAYAHKVYLGKSSNSMALISPENLTNCYLDVYSLSPATKYYWRVDEIWADGVAATGNVWSFTTVRK
jgi:predicted phosphodiesterase